MAQVKPKNFYPTNGPTDSAEVNANYTAFQGSLGTGDINQQNVRSEGVDLRQLSNRPIEKYVAQLRNGYLLSIGAVPAVDARYQSFSLSGIKEYPINHDNTGTTNTGVNKGTKLRINGTAGAEFDGDDFISVNWNLNLWANYIHTPMAELVTAIIDSNTKDGGSGATYPYGSGIGEWCFIVYPKYNTVSNALNDSDFKTAEAAGLVTGVYFDPSTLTGTPGLLTYYRGFDAFNWDHTMVVPSVFVSAGTANNSPFLMVNSNGTTIGGSLNGALGGPQMLNGSHHIKVKNNIGSTKLYGVQLYISGFWRMHGNTTGTGSPMNCGMFLEPDICNPSRVNTDGDPIPLYGVDGECGLERIQIDCTVYSTRGA